jgi:hypothetical protein
MWNYSLVPEKCMQPVTIKFSQILQSAAEQLSQITEAESALIPAPGKWSKKQVLGHLIDSAANNHQRFVRGQLTDGLSLLGYAQNDWVDVQRYNHVPWNDLLALWKSYNQHLLHVIAQMPAEKLTNTMRVGEGEPATLEFLEEDYVRHLQNHLRQILD